MGDSEAITLPENIFSNHPNCQDGWSEEYAQLIVKEALTRLKYEEDINKIIFTKYIYKEIDEGNISSEVCYIETEQAGYYFIMRDMLDSITVVYNRWD